jgi:outer membrane lipopolysaccharide assembly protein LptE/RlpB
MAVNGRTHETLDRCSCAIDVVASILPYQDYVSADTVLRMEQEKSFLAMEFRSEGAKQMVRRLREAEAEGDMRCF